VKYSKELLGETYIIKPGEMIPFVWLDRMQSKKKIMVRIK